MNSSTRQPNEHVLDLVLDYIEGRLDAETSDDVRQHLRGCEDCKEDFQHASALRGSAIEGDLRHLHSSRIVEIGDGRSMSIEERAHVDACGTCRDEIEWSTNLELPAELAEEITEAETTTSGEGFWATLFRPRFLMQSAGVLGAAAVLLFMVQPWSGSDSDYLSSIAQIRPLPVEGPQRGMASDGFESLRTQGLDFYRDGEYANALEKLQDAVRRRPLNADTQLYLGSTQLMLGSTADAMVSLQAAIDNCDADLVDQVAAAAHYLMANAYLKDGEGKLAESHLQSVLELEGSYYDEARMQLEEIQTK